MAMTVITWSAAGTRHVWSGTTRSAAPRPGTPARSSPARRKMVNGHEPELPPRELDVHLLSPGSSGCTVLAWSPTAMMLAPESSGIAPIWVLTAPEPGRPGHLH